jgi:LAS superfamily LD-carboxypeptidase LdcB
MSPGIVFSAAELTGRSRRHIVALSDPPCALHRAVVEPFLALRGAGRATGLELVPVSSFRDFDRQLAIWNGKCRGERPLLGVDGAPVAAADLDDDALVATILHWSALPGASRHHWGTDFDVIDAAALPEGYRPQLVPEEYAPGGVFWRLGAWLDVHAARFGFYRPYGSYRGGAQPEPWHLSYAPVAAAALRQFSAGMLREALRDADLAARKAVDERLPEIFERYVLRVDALPDSLSRATRPA